MKIFLERGYQIVGRLIDGNLINSLKDTIASNKKYKSHYGIRNLHHKLLLVNELASSNLILHQLHKFTGERQFKLIKAIFFNKNLKQNWAVAWHQDKTIAVKDKVIVPGFRNWTIKQGVHHVQPPLEVLEKIVTLRIALDPTDKSNGALKLVPHSHKLGILNQDKINQITQQQSSLFCSLQAGDSLIMSPLILHGSGKSLSNQERRTIHLEYSSGDLNSGLDWYC